MLPDNILQSDLLDILFENRNKAYGAYVLRKNYSQRLTIAIASVTGLILLLALMEQFKLFPSGKNYFPALKKDSIAVAYIDMREHKIEAILPKKIMHAQKKIDQIKNLVPVVADDLLIKDSVPTVDVLNNSQIGSTTITDASDGRSNIPEPSSTGSANAGVAKGPAIVETVLSRAEMMPQFPGGMDAFERFMKRNLKEADDLAPDERLMVEAKFVVGKDGSISGIEVLQSARNDLDAEVIRVINKMPKWIPGKQNGENVAVYFELPVTFVGTE